MTNEKMDKNTTIIYHIHIATHTLQFIQYFQISYFDKDQGFKMKISINRIMKNIMHMRRIFISPESLKTFYVLITK